MFPGRFVKEDKRLNAFAKGIYYGENGENFIYGGLYYNFDENYLANLVNINFKIRKGKNVLDDFKKVLSEKEFVNEKTIYLLDDIKGWFQPLEPLKFFKNAQTAYFYRYNMQQKLKLSEFVVSSSFDIDKKSGLVFLKVRGYEDRVFGKQVEWEVKKDIMREWFRLTENEKVKTYLEEVQKIYELFEYALPDSFYKPPISRIAFYLFPIELRSFNGSVFVSKVSLYSRKDKTRQELWKELLNEFEATEENKNKKEDLELALEEKGKNFEYLKNFLEISLNQNTLNILKKDWKEFLKKCSKKKSNKCVAVFVGKKSETNPPWISYGKYYVPSTKLKLYIFAEEDFKLEINGNQYNTYDILKILENSFLQCKFLGNIKIQIDKNIRSLEELFGGETFFKLIKGEGIHNSMLENKESIELLYSLMHFSTRLFDFINTIENEINQEQCVGILMLLNTEFDEGNRYVFWNMVNFIYNYFGIPIQTLTKNSLRAILSNQGKDSVIKNLAISLYKDFKILEVEFDGFYLPNSNTIVYVILEKPSPKFFYRRGDIENKGERHYLYEIYEIYIENKKAKIRLKRKYLELYDMIERGIEKFIEENKKYSNVRFCFITALKDSKIKELYEKLFTLDEKHKFLLIRYDELKSAYFSEKVEKECHIIYTQEFKKLFSKLEIPIADDEAVIAIKPAPPPTIDEDIYHPSLQLFFTEKIGWERDEVYSEKKNLFIFTVLVLSMYESESYRTPFSKLDLWTKEKNYYLKIKRNYKTYIFSLKSVLYELLFFIQKRPKLKETIQQI